MEKLERNRIEKFSIKQYRKYKKEGIPFRLVTGRGIEVHVIAENIGLNKDLIMVETEEQYNEWRKKPFVDWFAITNRGVNFYNGKAAENVYIQVGKFDIEGGDVVLFGSNESGFYFMSLFDGISCMDKKIGLCLQWTMDMYGGQFSLGGIFHDGISKEEFYIRKATEEEEDKYWKFVENNGYRYEEGGRLVFYPKVGQEYWTVEMVDGKYEVVLQKAPTAEKERPLHSLCFDSENRANQYIERLKR